MERKIPSVMVFLDLFSLCFFFSVLAVIRRYAISDMKLQNCMIEHVSFSR